MDVNGGLYSCFTLSLYPGVRVTVGVTEPKCNLNLNQETRPLAQPKGRHPREQSGTTGACDKDIGSSRKQ